MINHKYIKISTYRPSSRSSFVKLPAELRSSRKGLINIKDNDQKCFLWCDVRYINPAKIHPERITQNNKKLANDLDYNGVEFPVDKEDFSKIETKNNICINVFCYENKLTFPIYNSDQKFENSMDLSLIIDKNKSHYVYIKDFNRFMFPKTKNKNKKYFCKNCLQCFSSTKILAEHKEVCLRINGTQPIISEKGAPEFKNYFKQLPVPFKVYADFECNLKSVENYKGSYSKGIKITILVVLLRNLLVLMINSVSQLLFTKVKMLLLNLLKQFLKSMNTVKK